VSKTTLYKMNKSGDIQEYTAWADGKNICAVYGKVGGKMQNATVVAKGKNIGKSNESSPDEQALKEVAAKLQLKRDKGYFDTMDEALNEIVFLPMLAKDGRKVKITYPCDAQPKLDGVRCMAPGGNLMSRGGKPYDVKHISDKLGVFGSSHVPDGELYIHGMPLQNIVSLVKKPKPGSEKLEYWVYDYYSTDEELWYDRAYNLTLYDSIVPKGIKIVPTFRVMNEEAMLSLHAQFLQQGFEGTILRDRNGKYELGHRSSNLIKWKDFQDDEFTIVGYKEGVGKFVGCVIWECETVEGKKFSVAPKGTLEAKKAWYQEADQLIGKQLTVRYFAFTNDGIPQFPVGITIRDYE
jgi:DNA ligase-1